MVQWLKLPAWKVGDRGFDPTLALKFQRNKNVSSPLTRQDSILFGASVTELQIKWLEGCVISFIAPYSGGSPGPI